MESNQDVFISHSSADSKLAYAMCDYLEEKGIRCWIAPRDIPGGVKYGKSIIIGVKTCKIIVVLFNRNANDSEGVETEVERAFHYKITIIPFKLDETIPSDSLEFSFGSFQWLDATKGNPEDHFDLLYHNCARVLGKKERVIEEKLVLPLTTEKIESTVKDKPVPNQAIKENEIKKKKRSALIVLGSLLVLLLIFIFMRNNSVPPKTAVIKPTIQWASIPAGTFMMGSPASEVVRSDDESQHKVNLSAFKMSAHEVTFAQYDVFCGATKHKKAYDEGWGRGQRPVINVSYIDATAFAKWMGCRLPTEAEWEYACRAGSTKPFNTGENLTTEQANYNGNYPYKNNAIGTYREQTTKVGNFAANAWGLFDMHGNVWEWCSDWYSDNLSSPQTNPRGPSEGFDRVRRGGGWYAFASSSRAAFRGNDKPDFRYSDIGFRLVSLE